MTNPLLRHHAMALGIAVATASLLVAACGSGPIPGQSSSSSPGSTSSSPSSSGGCSYATAQSAITVDATDSLKFTPASVCLKVGGTVTWKSTSTITHTTTDEPSLAAKASDAAVPSGATGWNHSLSPGTSWSLKFTVAGLYKYFCIPHETLGMLGQITVVSSTSTSSSSSSSSGSSSTCSNPQSAVTVDATDSLKFSPASVCLKLGGKVTWKNTGTVTHTTTDEASLAAKASDAALPSGATGWNHTLAPGTSFTLKFTVAGLYKYFCIPHETLGMLGQITVVS